MRARLPSATFEAGYRLHRFLPVFGKAHDWTVIFVIGRFDDGTPFMLSYSFHLTAAPVTNWFCPEHLGAAVRRKVLGLFQAQIRDAAQPPAFLEQHDLRAQDKSGGDAASAEADRIYKAFYNAIWRAKYLNDRDEDYVDLSVPFAEKDHAKALGARWDSERRKWRVKIRADMAPFAQWMDHEATETSTAP